MSALARTVCDGCDGQVPNAATAQAIVRDAERQLTDERAPYRRAEPDVVLTLVEKYAGKEKADAVRTIAEQKGIIRPKEIVGGV